VDELADDIRVDHEPSGRKIAQVKEAARRLFLEFGFAATSMDAVAREANVSKATLYSYFPSKEALFANLIGDECTAIQTNLVIPSLSEGLETGLRRFAREYVRMFLAAKPNSLVRIMASESSRFPDMCLRFYEIGPMATTRRVAQFLLDARELGLISFPDAMTSASQFLSLVRGDLPLQTCLGIQQLTNDNVENDIEAGLATFMKAYKVA
jgi:AcrR family transcriptional regulator